MNVKAFIVVVLSALFIYKYGVSAELPLQGDEVTVVDGNGPPEVMMMMLLMIMMIMMR